MSKLSQLLPLVITLLVLVGFAFVAYQIYLGVTQIQKEAGRRMDRKNVVFTKDGMRVGVKHVETEQYVDSTQKWAVKAWNLGSEAKEGERQKQKKQK